jgi:hypothetical protein
MTDEQLQRIHDIEYSCDSRAELAERIVGLEDELARWERLTAGIELPEYPITQFQPKDLERENVLLRTFVDQMYRDMQRVLDMSTDTVFVDTIGTLRDKMDWYMRVMADLGMPPADYEKRLRELGMEVDG